MSGALGIMGVGFMSVILAALLSEMGFRGARLVLAVGIIILFISTVARLGEVISLLGGLVELPLAEGAISFAMRSVGIGYVGGVCSDVAEDLGSRGMANAVTVATRAEMLAAIMPLVKQLLELIIGEI